MWYVEFLDKDTDEIFCSYGFKKCSDAFTMKRTAQEVGHVYSPDPPKAIRVFDKNTGTKKIAYARIGMTVDKYGDCVRIRYREEV